MGKKLLIMLFAMFGMALQGMAQMEYKVRMPNIQKFVTLTKNGSVNIRKAPNASSPQVATLNKSTLEMSGALAVIGESGEWYKVYYYLRSGRYGYDSAIGYIIKSLCQEMPTRPVTEDMLQGVPQTYISMRRNGMYAGLCFSVDEYTDDGEMENVLYIGKQVNGFWVFDRMLPAVAEQTDLQMVRTNEYADYDISWKIEYPKSLESYDDNRQTRYLDAKKLSDRDVDYIVQNANRMALYDSHLIYAYKGEDFYRFLFYNPKDFGNDIVDK